MMRQIETPLLLTLTPATETPPLHLRTLQPQGPAVLEPPGQLVEGTPGNAEGMGANRHGHRPRLQVHSPLLQRWGDALVQLLPPRADARAPRRQLQPPLQTGGPQHRAPLLLHSLLPPLVADLQAPHRQPVPPLLRRNSGPILRNGLQAEGAYPKASRHRFRPTGPER